MELLFAKNTTYLSKMVVFQEKKTGLQELNTTVQRLKPLIEKGFVFVKHLVQLVLMAE